jgi:hypothetical protein
MKLNFLRANWPLKGAGGADRISRRPIIGVGVAGDNLSTYGRRVASAEAQKRKNQEAKAINSTIRADDRRQEVAPPFACQQSDVSSAASPLRWPVDNKKWTQFQQPARWQLVHFVFAEPVLSCQPMN